jgi:hypothetical protein
MDVGKKTAFYYHADASVLGGTLKQPVDRVMATDGSVSLAQAGGFNSLRVDSFRLDGLMAFDTANVSVSGSEQKEEGGWRTITTATVEQLNILHVVTADRIVAQVSVMHPFDENRPSEITFNGTQFVNLRVNGEPVQLTMDRRLFGSATVDGMDTGSGGRSPVKRPCFNDLIRVAEAQHRENAPVQKKLVERFGQRFAWRDPQVDLEKKGIALCSLVREVKAEAPAEGYAHVLHVPDFGNIFLGEALVGRFSAQVTMLRVEMGCMASGTLSVVSTFSNGSTMP